MIDSGTATSDAMRLERAYQVGIQVGYARAASRLRCAADRRARDAQLIAAAALRDEAAQFDQSAHPSSNENGHRFEVAIPE